MKFKLELTLGNDAMQTGKDISRSLFDSLKGEEHLPLEVGVGGVLWDVNGNTVGKWKVIEEQDAQLVQNPDIYRAALEQISRLWPEPPNCADVNPEFVGPNGGKSRAILLKAALEIARTALGKMCGV